MSEWVNARSVLVALAGIVGFGVLMGLRQEASGGLPRALVASFAFCWGAACVVWLVKSRR